jgi:SNF2 family DNA or RNA helicase
MQSEARAHRGGSEIHEKITRIDMISKDTIEEQIHWALEHKQDVAELVMSLKKEGKCQN